MTRKANQARRMRPRGAQRWMNDRCGEGVTVGGLVFAGGGAETVAEVGVADGNL
jgi:predicted acylesterase/phospholipase RssA